METLSSAYTLKSRQSEMWVQIRSRFILTVKFIGNQTLKEILKDLSLETLRTKYLQMIDLCRPFFWLNQTIPPFIFSQWMSKLHYFEDEVEVEIQGQGQGKGQGHTVRRISNFAGFKQNFTFQVKLSFASFELFGVKKWQKFWSCDHFWQFQEV